MDGDQLSWYYRNPQYLEAVERNLRESSELSELLEEDELASLDAGRKGNSRIADGQVEGRSCSGQGVERKLAWLSA